MRKYSKAEIAFIIYKKIFELYTDPVAVLRDFDTEINLKIRLSSQKKLSHTEIFNLTKESADEISANLRKITLPLIIKNLSTEIVTKGREGIEIANYEDYFSELSEKIVQKKIREGCSLYRKKKRN